MARNTQSLVAQPTQNVQLSVAQQEETEGNSDASENVPSPTIRIPPSPQGPQPPVSKKKLRDRGVDCRDKWRLGVEIATLVAGIIGLIGLYCTLSETRRQADVAQQHLVLSERPWVSVDVVAAEPLVFGADGAEMEIQFTLRNLGHSPARHVNLHFKAISISGNVGEAVVKQQAICSRMRGMPNDADVRDTILPEGRLVQRRAFRIKKDEVDKKTYSFPERSIILLAVVGCADYRFAFAEGHHQTGFVFLMVRRDPQSPHKWISIDPTVGTIPAEQVGFHDYGGVNVD